eukprot:gene11297-7830_t
MAGRDLNQKRARAAVDDADRSIAHDSTICRRGPRASGPSRFTCPPLFLSIFGFPIGSLREDGAPQPPFGGVSFQDVPHSYGPGVTVQIATSSHAPLLRYALSPTTGNKWGKGGNDGAACGGGVEEHIYIYISKDVVGNGGERRWSTRVFLGSGGGNGMQNERNLFFERERGSQQEKKAEGGNWDKQQRIGNNNVESAEDIHIYIYIYIYIYIFSFKLLDSIHLEQGLTWGNTCCTASPTRFHTAGYCYHIIPAEEGKPEVPQYAGPVLLLPSAYGGSLLSLVPSAGMNLFPALQRSTFQRMTLYGEKDKQQHPGEKKTGALPATTRRMRHTHDCQEIWPLGEHRGSHLWNGWLPYHHSLVLDGCLVHMLLLLLFCILFLPGASVIGYRFITPVLALVVVEVREGRETMLPLREYADLFFFVVVVVVVVVLV